LLRACLSARALAAVDGARWGKNRRRCAAKTNGAEKEKTADLFLFCI